MRQTIWDELNVRFERVRNISTHTEQLNNELAFMFTPPSATFGGTRNGKDGNDTAYGSQFGSLYDTTGVTAVQALVSYIMGALFNPGQEWSSATLPTNIERAPASEITPATKEQLRRYLSLVNKSCLEYLIDPAVGFYSALENAVYEELVFGQGFILADIHPIYKHLRFRHVPLQNLLMDWDEDGKPDTVFRTYQITIRELCEQYPAERLYQGEYPSHWFEAEFDRSQLVTVCHAVLPRDKYMAVKDSKKMPKHKKRYGEYYFIPADQPYFSTVKTTQTASNVVLSCGGFDHNPYISLMWHRLGAELHPSGPARTALPAMRVINEQRKNFLNATDIMLRPPSFSIANALTGGLPKLGSRNNHNIINPDVFEMSGGDIGKVFQFMTPPIQIEPTLMNIQQDQNTVRNIFFNDVIEIAEKKAEMREVEVLAKQEERMRAMMVPLIRMYDQLAEPVLRRVVEHLIDKEAVPAIPESFNSISKRYGKLYTLRFNSAMARAFSMLELSNMNRVLQQMVLPLAQFSPDVLDVVHPLRYVNAVFNLSGINPDFMRTEEEFNALQTQKAEAEAQAQQAQSLRDGGAGVKDLAQAQKLLGG
jgi:hypothetical protein